MRFVFYTLTAIALAVIAIGGSFSYSPGVNLQVDGGFQRGAFVDVEKLMRLHPSYEALPFMEQAATDLRPVESLRTNVEAKTHLKPARYSATCQYYRDRRLKLELEVANKAADALCRLQSYQHLALDARARAVGLAMADSFMAEARVKARELSEIAAQRTVAEAGLGLADRVNAQLGVIALRRAAKGLGVELCIGEKLSMAESQLDAIDGERKARLQAISDEVKAETEQLFQEARDKAEAALAVYRHGESNRIDNCSAVARAEITRELRLFDGFSFGGRFASAEPQRYRQVVAEVKTNAIDAAKYHQRALRERVSEVRKRIRRDVARAVLTIAKENGYKVSFSREGLPDETHKFEQLLRERAWEDCEPVLCRSLGS